MEDEIIKYILAKQRETPKLAKNSLNNEGKKFKKRIEYYRIEDHLNEFLKKEYYNRLIIMPGLRGVGKTSILFQLYEHLIKNGVRNENILYLDVGELFSYFDTDILTIINIFLKIIHQTTIVDLNEKIFLLIDETHYDKNWINASKILHDKSKNIFMIFTGSSAIDLEVNVDAVRRIKKEEIYPCNFPEYLLLKHDIKYPQSMNDSLKDLIFKGDKNSIKIASNNENKVQKDLYSLKNDPQIEFENFLYNYSFPFALNLNENEIYKYTFDIVKKIIEKDIPSIKTFNTSTNFTISRIITYLAMQKPGGTSNIKLAESLSVSPKTVNDILNTLEKTQLIFSIKPYGTGGKVIKKPWEYFFLAPSLKSAINFDIGRYEIRSRKCLATLAETMVISSLFKIKNTSKSSLGLFYDSEKKGVDFLIKHYDKIIPIEVGIGKKTKSQIKRSINRYGCEYGILISNRTSQIKHEKNVINIPLMTFGYL